VPEKITFETNRPGNPVESPGPILTFCFWWQVANSFY